MKFNFICVSVIFSLSGEIVTLIVNNRICLEVIIVFDTLLIPQIMTS